jgi:hypothetical protein
VLRRCYETGDFEPLREWYAPDAVFDGLVSGSRVRLEGGDAIVDQLGAWWPTPGRLLRWEVEACTSGMTVELEREVGDDLRRQRHFVQLEGGVVVRQQAYAARPQGRGKAAVPPPLPPGYDVVERVLLTHPGQSGNSIERIVLRDGTKLVLKHLVPGDWLSSNTGDDGREVLLHHAGVYAGLPDALDACVVDAYDSTLVLRDVGDSLLTRMTHAESTRVLEATAALHREFVGFELDGLCTLEDRMTLAAPARIESHAFGLDFIAKVFYVGWEVFHEVAPADVAEAIARVHADPRPLADELRASCTTLLHGDLRWANLALGERVVLLDWGLASLGPPAADFSWYLFVNGRRVDATYEELIDDFRVAEGALHDERTLELAWLAQLAMHGGLLAHELVESDAAKRDIALRELDWWYDAARRGLEHLAPA